MKTRKNNIGFSFISCCFYLLSALLAQTASANTIEYSLTALGGNNYRYDYTVINDGSLGTGIAIEGFFISFDPAQYDESSLNIVTSAPLAADWDEMILGSGLGVPADYDVYALAGGIGVGESISGFAVEFAWLGSGTPGAQPFGIYDPETFETIDSGTTSLIASAPGNPDTPEIPEPSTLFLLLAAFAARAALQSAHKKTYRLSTNHN